MDILLSHGYFLMEDDHEQQIMKPYPPLSILYISSHLKSKGFDVEVFDSTFAAMGDFEKHISEKRPAVVGLSCNLLTKFRVLDQIRICKGFGARVILGGPEPVSYADSYLEAGADIVVAGEGERTLEELIPHLSSHGMDGLDVINGIIYLDGEGRPIRTEARPMITKLSAQRWPDREAIDLARYHATWKSHHGYSSTSIITARGCPYVCKWCSHSVFGFSHRRREPEDVVDEVLWLVERYDPDQLWYADDVLTINPRWFLRYAALLKEKGIHKPFECISRADRLNDDVINALGELGCRRLWIGAESGSQRILDAMERKTKVTDIQMKTKRLQSKGIEVGMFIMLGYKGEEESDISATISHLKQANPDVFLTTVAYPIKGTRYYEEVEDKIYSDIDWEGRSDRDLLLAGRRSSGYYKHATRWMVNEVNLYKALHSEKRNYFQIARMFVNAKRGRIGMRLTKSRQGEPPGPG
jgi:anaerobic magnesium-protoporphyrin IX monomethyl ester cyclase